MTTTDPFDRQDPELPDDLVSDLAELWRTPDLEAGVPVELDRTVLTAARRQLWRRRAAAVLTSFDRRHVAAAAAVAALVFGYRLLDGPSRAVDPLDVDRSGRVDIVDAYVLARRVEDTRPSELSLHLDCDGDGNVDSRDVDHIAQRVVRLDG